MIDFSTEYFLGESLHSLTPEPSPKAQKLLAGLDTCLEGTFQGISLGMFFGRLAAFIPSSRKFKDACRDVHLFIGERIDEASRDVEKDTGRVVLMNQLVKDTNDKALILSTATTFYSAGTDTSSITIGMILFLLSRHPKVLAKARAEILAMTHGVPDMDTLKRLHYLRAIINESKFHCNPCVLKVQELLIECFSSAPVSRGPDSPADRPKRHHITYRRRARRYISNLCKEGYYIRRQLSCNASRYRDMG